MAWALDPSFDPDELQKNILLLQNIIDRPSPGGVDYPRLPLPSEVGTQAGVDILQFSTRGTVSMGSTGSHFGTVKKFRNKFSTYSKEDFRKMGKDPLVKDILSGMTKLNQDQIMDRIKEHLSEEKS